MPAHVNAWNPWDPGPGKGHGIRKSHVKERDKEYQFRIIIEWIDKSDLCASATEISREIKGWYLMCVGEKGTHEISRPSRQEKFSIHRVTMKLFVCFGFDLFSGWFGFCAIMMGWMELKRFVKEIGWELIADLWQIYSQVWMVNDCMIWRWYNVCFSILLKFEAFCLFLWSKCWIIFLFNHFTIRSIVKNFI